MATSTGSSTTSSRGGMSNTWSSAFGSRRCKCARTSRVRFGLGGRWVRGDPRSVLALQGNLSASVAASEPPVPAAAAQSCQLLPPNLRLTRITILHLCNPCCLPAPARKATGDRGAVEQQLVYVLWALWMLQRTLACCSLAALTRCPLTRFCSTAGGRNSKANPGSDPS